MIRTFPRVKELLEKEADKNSVNQIVKRTGLNHNTVTSYIRGSSEPTQKSLELIAKTYGVSVAWLRADTDAEPLTLNKISPVKRQLWGLIQDMGDEKAQNLLKLLT